MRGRGRDDLRLFLPRQPHPHLVACRVRRHPLMVEDHRQREQALANSLARLPSCGERRDEVDDLCRRYRVDAPIAKQRQEHPHGAAMLQPGVLGDVDPALLPAARGLAQRRCPNRIGGVERRDALRGELGGNPSSTNSRLTFGLERPAVADPRLAPAEPVLHPVALAAVLRRPRPDPDASHERPHRGLRLLRLSVPPRSRSSSS